jgi:hypothetical protein
MADAERRIFISYQRNDHEQAVQLKDQLEQLHPDVWLDKENLRAGQRWWDQILCALREADVVVLIVSPRYLRSEACRAEWRYALALERTVIPVEVDTIDIYELPTEIADLQLVRKDQFGKLMRGLAEAQTKPLPDPLPKPPAAPLTWSKVIDVVRSKQSVDHDTQFAVAVKLIENLWSSPGDTPAQVPELAAEFLRREHLDARARRLLEAALQPVSVSWAQVRRVVEAPGSADATTHVAVAVKLIENLLLPAPDAPPDVADLAAALRSHPDTDLRAKRLLQAALPSPRAWFPVVGALLAGFALTHLLWATGLYEYLNGILGTARGPILANGLLALVGVVLCAVAWRSRVKGARLAFWLCIAGVVATLLDAIKIRWIPVDWPF